MSSLMIIRRVLPARWAAWSGPAGRRRSTVLLVSGMLGCLLGCSGDTALTLPTRSTAQAYWTLQLSQRAVNLALTEPYDTLQLTATPLDAAGMPLSGAGPVTFQGHDSTVTVSATGVLTAHYVTPVTQIIASLRVNGVTLTDTAFIKVTSTVPQYALANFSMQPASGDSAKRNIDFGADVSNGTANDPVGGDKTGISWPVTATNSNGTTICSPISGCSLLVAYSTSNPYVAYVQKYNSGNSIALYPRLIGSFSFFAPGHVYLLAATWAYGVVRRDSVDFTVGLPLNFVNTITSATVGGQPGVAFGTPPHMALGVGAVVQFWNQTPTPVDVMFTPTAGIDTVSYTDQLGNVNPPIGSSNIPAFGGDTTCDTLTFIEFGLPLQSCPVEKWVLLPQDYSVRRFTKPGVYQYHSTVIPSAVYTIDIDDDR